MPAIKKTAKKTATVSRAQCMAFARFCANCASLEDAGHAARVLLNTLPATTKRGTWQHYLQRFATWAESGGTLPLPHSIFAMAGNVKLPFVAFSTLPVVTCPGAGDCLEYCYSLRAWRYPAAFLRQAMNTLLLRFKKRQIVEAFKRLPENITFRLYVDGDFDSIETLGFWMGLIGQRPDIDAYGYSKSWELFLAFPVSRFPSNYALNISSGSRYDTEQDIRQRMLALPITRGEFVAVKLSRKHSRGFAKYKEADYHRDVRESAQAEGIGKVFSCPGTCGGCTMQGHACGAGAPANSGRKFLVELPIAIGIH